jgi:hypothetical protein
MTTVPVDYMYSTFEGRLSEHFFLTLTGNAHDIVCGGGAEGIPELHSRQVCSKAIGDKVRPFCSTPQVYP